MSYARAAWLGTFEVTVRESIAKVLPAPRQSSRRNEANRTVWEWTESVRISARTVLAHIERVLARIGRVSCAYPVRILVYPVRIGCVSLRIRCERTLVLDARVFVFYEE